MTLRLKETAEGRLLELFIRAALFLLAMVPTLWLLWSLTNLVLGL